MVLFIFTNEQKAANPFPAYSSSVYSTEQIDLEFEKLEISTFNFLITLFMGG